MHRTADRHLPLARHGQALASRIPGAELIVAEGGDHVSIFTQNREIKPRVVRFLRQHAPGSAAGLAAAPR